MQTWNRKKFSQQVNHYRRETRDYDLLYQAHDKIKKRNIIKRLDLREIGVFSIRLNKLDYEKQMEVDLNTSKQFIQQQNCKIVR